MISNHYQQKRESLSKYFYLSIQQFTHLIIDVNQTIVYSRQQQNKLYQPTWMSEEIQPQIKQRFEIIRKIGSGAYGHVWKARNKQTNQAVALKKIFDAFQHSTDAQRTFRQISYLKQFNHKNIIKMKNIFKSENEKDVYIEFEYMEVDLHRVIREDILKEKHKRYIIYQIAKAIKYLHSAELIHRDLKPSNVLLNEQCLIKLCDFGLVRSTSEGASKQELIMTEYVATRWYRAPELLLGWNKYSKAVDIWSFGCLIGELFKNKPMFPGGSTLDQLQKVIAWTGYPINKDLDAIKGNDGDTLISAIKTPKNKPATKEEWFANSDPELKTLLMKMLQFNPSKRPTIQEVISHPYLSMFHDAQNEPTAKHPIHLDINDSIKLSVKAYRERIWRFCNPTVRAQSPINIVKRSQDLSCLSKSSIKRRSLKAAIKQEKPLSISKTLYLKNKKAVNFKSTVIAPLVVLKPTRTPSRQRRLTEAQSRSRQKIISYDSHLKQRYLNNSSDLKDKSLGNSSKILNQEEFQSKRKSISTIKKRINCSDYKKGNLVLF